VNARLAATLLAGLAAAGGAAAGPRLAVVDASGVVMTAPLAADGRWCLVWNHSVTGIEVRDCFRAEGATLVLETSHQPDFAAGLGATPGRGTVVSDGTHGYRIEGIDMTLPPEGLTLRVGSTRVGHRIAIDGHEIPLPAALARQRVTIRVEPDA
jgi:hypothetical protein